MTTMPSPVDLRIWLLSRVMGWPGRRIASEVGVSQPTVVRTLERLTKEPPTDQEMQEFVNPNATPPHGLPVIDAETNSARPDTTSRLVLVLTGSVILITLAVATVLVALAVAILQH